MIKILIEKLWNFVPEKYRKIVMMIAVFLTFAILFAFFLMCRSDSDSGISTAIISGYTDRQKYEIERTERIVDAIDKRKEAELNAVQKDVISADDVLSTLDTLLGLKSGK